MKLKASTVVFVACCLSFPLTTQAQEERIPEKKEPVAQVGEVIIYRNQIGPDLPASKQGRLLAKRIAEVILEAAVVEQNIKVTEKEVALAVEGYLKTAGIGDAQTEEIRASHQAAVDALREVIKGGDPDRIYDERLKGKMPRQVWDSWRLRFNTAEKIEKFAASIPKSTDDLRKQVAPSIRKRLELQKLVEELTSAIMVGDAELRQEYTRLHPEGKPPFEQVRASLQEGLLAKKKSERLDTWWRTRLEKARVKVLAKDLEGVLQSLQQFPMGMIGGPARQ